MERKLLAKLLNQHGFLVNDTLWNKYWKTIILFKKTRDRRLPRAGEIRKELRNLKEATKQFNENLENLSYHALGKILDGLKTEDDMKAGLNIFEQLKDDSKWLAERTSTAIENLPTDTGGRNKQFWKKQFIVNLASLWEQITSTRPTVTYSPHRECYAGPFFDFVKLSCDFAEFEYHSEKALGKSIQRSLA